jgi:hypothetical protein
MSGFVGAATGPTKRQLLPGWRKALLTAHIVATISLIGTDLVLVALGVSGLRGADPVTLYPAASLVASALIRPLALVALGTGLLQAGLTPWGFVRYWWVAIKLAVTTALTIVVFFVLVPGLATAAHAVTGASAEPLSDAERLRIALYPSFAVILLLMNAVLGVYKPAWRLRAGARQAVHGDVQPERLSS